MLGLGHEVELSEQLWHALPERVVLPPRLLAAQQSAVSEPVMYDCLRQYARRPLHSIAIVTHCGERYACQTKDISRVGVGLYMPVNMLPKKLLELWLPNRNLFLLRVTRCRRLAEECYEVGARFCGSAADC